MYISAYYRSGSSRKSPRGCLTVLKTLLGKKKTLLVATIAGEVLLAPSK